MRFLVAWVEYFFCFSSAKLRFTLKNTQEKKEKDKRTCESENACCHKELPAFRPKAAFPHPVKCFLCPILRDLRGSKLRASLGRLPSIFFTILHRKRDSHQVHTLTAEAKSPPKAQKRVLFMSRPQSFFVAHHESSACHLVLGPLGGRSGGGVGMLQARIRLHVRKAGLRSEPQRHGLLK